MTPQAFGPDAWWQERRVLVRALLDQGDAKTAYRIAAEAVTPEKPVFRGDKYFTAGWIALRYLHDAEDRRRAFRPCRAAQRQPARVCRAAAIGRAAPPKPWANTPRPSASTRWPPRYTATYYGQLARARLGFERPRPARPAACVAARARRHGPSRGGARGGTALRAQRARPARLDLRRDRRQRHRHRRHGHAGGSRRQA